MREDWSKEDRKAANIDTPSWQSNDTELPDDDVDQLQYLLKCRKINGEETDPNFIGTPDSNSFDPDI